MILIYKNIEDIVSGCVGGGRGRRRGRWRRRRRGRCGWPASVFAARVLVVRLLDVREERRESFQHHTCKHVRTINIRGRWLNPPAHLFSWAVDIMNSEEVVLTSSQFRFRKFSKWNHYHTNPPISSSSTEVVANTLHLWIFCGATIEDWLLSQ